MLTVEQMKKCIHIVGLHVCSEGKKCRYIQFFFYCNLQLHPIAHNMHINEGFPANTDVVDMNTFVKHIFIIKTAKAIKFYLI